MYLTYAEYQSMGGTLTENIFNDYEFRAESLINSRTFNRLVKDTSFPMQVKRLVKYIIDLVDKQSSALSLGNNNKSSDAYITSQSNDGVSISYSGMASTDLFALCDTNIQKSINNYLQGVSNSAGRNLLYRGLYEGE
jgi:hypothetical protein